MSVTAAAVLVAVLLVAARLRPRGVPRISNAPDRISAGRPPFVHRRGAGRPRGASIEASAAAVLDTAAREVRSGSSVGLALRAALTQHTSILPELTERLRRGEPVAGAADGTLSRHPAEAVLLQTVRTAVRTGGPVADTFDRGAEVLRERVAWANERRAHGAQARLSATLLTLVPVGFAALGFVASARVRTAYSEVPATVPLTVLGVLVNAAGWSWMRRLIRGVES